MFNFKRFTAAAVSAALAAGTFGCTPAIGAGSQTAVNVNGYEVPAGVFIYYTLQSYNEASNVLKEQNGSAPSTKELRNSKIDSVDSTDWIQNKATDSCVRFAAIEQEFEAINGTLSAEDLDSAQSYADYIMSSADVYTSNGVGAASARKIAENAYKEQAVFNYYYGFDGPDGCSEDELKDYFDENVARVKYLTISLTDNDGEKLSEDEVRKRRKMAEQYAKDINSKSKEMDKMLQVNDALEDYNEYVESLVTTTASEDGTPETTTTTVADTTEATTTTTNLYANERLIQRETTTSADVVTVDDSTTEPTESEKNQSAFNKFVFNDLGMGKAQVYDYDDDTIYVIIRGDLRVRMTEDDCWSEDYISNLRSMKYYDAFSERMDAKVAALSYEKNKSAYRRYAPFKLKIEG